jgi:hypothetical protein
MTGYRFSLGLALLAASVTAQSVNVKDFGAKGDGQTDDTHAIHAAIAALRSIGAPYPGTAYYSESQELYFPPGKYQISEALVVGSGRFRGDGAVIEQTDAAKDILTTTWAWRMTVSGFTFLGGRNQLVLHNPNLDTGQITVEQCRFYGAKGVALDVDMVSTTLAVRDCVFLACRQVWVNRGCDQAVMRDCWITTDADMRRQAAIEHRAGRLTIENLCGVPLVNGADQRWIDNYGGNLTCRGVRFGGEGGGFTPVVNFSRYTNQFGPAILLEDCFICANGSSLRNFAVYCEELPNQISIRDCTLAGAGLLGLSERIDLRTYFRVRSRDLLSFSASGNTGEQVGRLPELLAHPVVTPPKSGALSAAETKGELAKAAAAIRPQSGEDSTGGEYAGHRQQTEPGTFIDLCPPAVRWTLDDLMDATRQPNSEHLALLPVETDVLLMRRTPARDNWPHVTLPEVSLDLDGYPFLAWKQKATGSESPGTYAVRVKELGTGTELLLEENYYPPWDAYRAYDLRRLFGLSGRQTFRIKYYYLGVQSVGKESRIAEPGDSIVLDFLRAEAE